MIGLDTNVLVRYLVQDDAAQARLASAAIESAAGRGERMHLTAVTLCELVWVLESAYHRARTDVALALQQIVRTADFASQLLTARRPFPNCALDQRLLQGHSPILTMISV